MNGQNCIGDPVLYTSWESTCKTYIKDATLSNMRKRNARVPGPEVINIFHAQLQKLSMKV